jgi:outer membrane receptor protein involved in Fe transport
LSLGATGRYVGRAYLDNTNSSALATPSFFNLDANVSYAVTNWARVSLQVNNALNNERIYPSGYSYLFVADGEVTGIPYFYPQATRNFVVLFSLSRAQTRDLRLHRQDQTRKGER